MATPHEFTIPVTNLDAGGKEFHFPLRTAWLRSALEESGVGVGAGTGETATAPGEDAGSLTLRASKSGVDIVLHGRLTATLFTDCARCTGPARVHIDEPVTTLAVPASSISARPAPAPRAPARSGDAAGKGDKTDRTDRTDKTEKSDKPGVRLRTTAGAHGPGGAELREKVAQKEAEARAAEEKKGGRGRGRSHDNDLAEYEFTAEEADTLTYEGDLVVLDDFVRDELLLEIPMIPLCSEDCAGIQPGPSPRESDPSDEHGKSEPGGGEDERGIGIDPRLAPLLKLKL